MRNPVTLAKTLSRAYGHGGAVVRAYARLQRADAWALVAYEFGCTPREVERRRERTQFWYEVLQVLHAIRHIPVT